jgi:hypothetical protein
MAIKIIKKLAPTNKTQSTVKTNDVTNSKTEAQYAYELFIDKISITIAVPGDHLASVWEAVEAAIKVTAIFQKAHWSPNAHWSSGYKINRLISCTGTEERVRFQFGPKDGKPPHCRLEFNPHKMGFDGISGLDSVLEAIFTEGWDYVVKNGRVSRLDVAIDLPGVRMDQFLFLAHQGATYQKFATNGHLETFYFGTSKGNQTRIYSKKKEQLAKGKSFGKSVVRVERTLRNLNMTIADLHQLTNPFAKMVLTVQTPEPPQWEKPKVWSMFEDSVHVRGLTAALALLPEQRRSKYRKYLKQKSQPCEAGRPHGDVRRANLALLRRSGVHGSS